MGFKVVYKNNRSLKRNILAPNGDLRLWLEITGKLALVRNCPDVVLGVPSSGKINYLP